MFACSCCIVIRVFVSSREGQFCKSTPDDGARSQFCELSPFHRLNHGKLIGSLWCINYLCFSTTTLIMLFYALYDFAARRLVNMSTQLKNFAAIHIYTPRHFYYKWFKKRCEFFKIKSFQNVYDEGLSPLSPLSKGLLGLGRALRWCISRVRCEHEGLSLSYKD
jgi:hypothetical protein